MPKEKAQGRGFDMYENLTWAQRIDKEEACVLRGFSESSLRGAGEEVLRSHPRKPTPSGNVSQKSGRMQHSQSWAGSSMRGIPSDLQAMCKMPVLDSCLITMRQPPAGKHVTKLRFVAETVVAPWIPGLGKYVAYKPEFYISMAKWDPKSLLKPSKPGMSGGTGGSRSHGSRRRHVDRLPAAEVTGASWATSQITEQKSVAESANVPPK